MKCDKCGGAEGQQKTNGPGTGGGWWCDQCCKAAEVWLPKVAPSYDDGIRERWKAAKDAERKRKHNWNSDSPKAKRVALIRQLQGLL